VQSHTYYNAVQDDQQPLKALNVGPYISCHRTKIRSDQLLSTAQQ